MTDRENVISDLEEQIAWIRDNDFHKFPGWGHAVLAMRDAVALLKEQEAEAVDAPKPDSDIGCWYDITHNYTLEQVVNALKAQEPRVIKVGDVRKWVNSDRVTREPVVIEIRGGVCAWIIDDEVRELPGEANLSSDLYGKTWRCWTSRPTDEMRRETPWN